HQNAREGSYAPGRRIRPRGGSAGPARRGRRPVVLTPPDGLCMARPMSSPGRARCKWAARTAALALLAVSSGIVPRPAPAALIRDNLYDVKALDAREAWA